MNVSKRDEARALLAHGLAAEALRLYEEHLAENDDDHEARLEYGIAALAGGDREKFVSIGMEYAPCMSRGTLDRLGERFRSLWAEYAGTCARLARASAVGASVALACQAGGCGGKTAQPDAAPAADTAAIEPDSMAVEPEADPPPAPPVPIAQAADTSTGDEAATPESANVDPSKPKPKPKPRPLSDMPKTRYVAVQFDKDDGF